MATLRQIQEALTQTSGAQYLYQPVIDRALFELTRKWTSTRTLFPRRTWATPKYQFNRRSNSIATRAVVESPPNTGTGSVSATSSSYTPAEFEIKHWQTNLDFSKFSVQVARLHGDLVQSELEAATESAMWFEETVNFYGSQGATKNTWRPEWDGVDLLMARANKIVVNDGPTIALLDAMIDSVKKALGRLLGTNQYAFVCSSELLSTTGRLFQQQMRQMGKAVIYPRDDRGQLGGQITDNRNYIDGGLEVATYRGIPFVESSFIASAGTMSTVTPASPTGTDGVITAGTYYYAFEVVTDQGVSVAYETTQVTISSTQHVAFSWTAPSITDTEGNVRQNLLYRVHRTTTNGAAGTETLYAVFAARDLANDAAVTAWTDYGTILTSDSGNGTSTVITVYASGSEAIPDAVTTPRLNPGGHTQQDIFLLPRDPDILVVPVVNELQTVPLALVNSRTQQVNLQGDQVLAVRGPGFMAKACSVYAN